MAAGGFSGPILRVPPAAPAAALRFEHAPGGLGEGGNAKFAAASSDDDPLDPASRSGGLDEQVQAIAVSVSSGRRGTDEGGREGLGGMAPSALGSAGCGAQSGRAKTKRLFPLLGVSSGVMALQREALPPVPVPATTYCRPSTA